MNDVVLFLVAHSGWILFATSFAEQMGLPLPGAAVVVAGGALAANGNVGLPVVIGWVAAGCAAADTVWFILGSRGKGRVLRWFPHLHAVQVRLDRTTLAKTVLYGTRMLAVANFLPFGSVIALHAGALDVGRFRLLMANTVAATIYAAVYAALGFAFHDQLEQILIFLNRSTAAVVVLVVVLAAGALVRWHRLRRRPRPHADRCVALEQPMGGPSACAEEPLPHPISDNFSDVQ